MLKIDNPLLGNPTMSFPKEWQKYFDGAVFTAKSGYTKGTVPAAPVIPSLCSAISTYIKATNGSRGIAYLSNGCVAAEIDDGIAITRICVLNPLTGDYRVSIVNSITKQKYKVTINPHLPQEDGTMYSSGDVVWLALMPQILEDAEALLAMQDLEKAITQDNQDEVRRALSLLNDNVFTRATDKDVLEDVKLTIKNEGEDRPLKEVALDRIRKGEYQISSTVIGELTLFGKTQESKGPVEIDREKVNLNLSVDDEVKGHMIEDLKGYKPTETVRDVCNVINLGYENPDLLINNFYFIGPPGAGKSKDAEAIAYYLGLPFYVLGLSSGVTEETLRGVILPSLEGTILSDDEKAVVETISKMFPSDMSIDITPSEAFEKMTGKKKKNIDVLTVYQEAYSKLYAYAEKLEKKPAKGVSYIYIPSPLVLAGRFGGVIEIQESSSPSDPACLSCVNEFMNRPDGVLDTPAGQIRRHKNCIVIMTDNYATDIGYSPMNQAVKDRAGAMSFWYENPTPQEMVDRALASGIEVDKNTLYDMAETVAIIAEVASDPGNSIKATAGYRSFLNWAKAVQMGFTIKKSFELAVINKMATNPEERELLMDASAGTPIQ